MLVKYQSKCRTCNAAVSAEFPDSLKVVGITWMCTKCHTKWPMDPMLDRVVENTAAPAPDMVNSPPHYTSHPSGVECIEVTEHYNFCVGNAIKYLWRAGLKGSGAKGVEDLKKAAWYINREIDRLGPNGEGLLQDPVQGQTR